MTPKMFSVLASEALLSSSALAVHSARTVESVAIGETSHFGLDFGYERLHRLTISPFIARWHFLSFFCSLERRSYHSSFANDLTFEDSKEVVKGWSSVSILFIIEGTVITVTDSW
jgi:hypothetical protein